MYDYCKKQTKLIQRTHYVPVKKYLAEKTFRMKYGNDNSDLKPMGFLKEMYSADIQSLSKITVATFSDGMQSCVQMKIYLKRPTDHRNRVTKFLCRFEEDSG